MSAQLNETPEMTPETEAAAEEMLARLADTVERLHLVVQRETELMRNSRLKDAAGLEDEKRLLAGEYQRTIELLRRHAPALAKLAPERAAALRERHASFQEDLAVNMAVLGTARSVAEDIMRSVASRVGEHQAPKTYIANGATNVRAMATPLKVSRKS
jgi:hypothetical protein